METINTIIAVHNHQPIGNVEHVFEETYRLSYMPFVDVLGQHPSLRFSQHWIATLLAWFAKHHPEMIKRRRAMVNRGQLEILSGSYYEAVVMPHWKSKLERQFVVTITQSIKELK